MPPLILRPAAEAEIEEAYRWYEGRGPGLGVIACFHVHRDPRRWRARQ
jgi:hypothetical protein